MNIKTLLKISLALILFSSHFIAQTTYYVSTSGSNSNDGSQGNPWATIQYAIDQASNMGDSLIITSGTYTPTSTILINKSGLVLMGSQVGIDPRPSQGSSRTAGALNETIIDGGGILSNLVKIEADNVTVNGFEIKSGTGDMVYQSTSHSNTKIKYNIVHNGLGDEGIQLKYCTNGIIEKNYVYDIASPGDGLNFGSGSSNCSILNNELTDVNSLYGAIYVYGNTGITVADNIIHDITTTNGMRIGDTGDSAATIQNNTIYNISGDGIKVMTIDVKILGNDIYNCSGSYGGIYIYSNSANDTISGNDIHDNTLGTSAAGILIANGVDAANISIYSNNIYNNSPSGMVNLATASLMAENNYWGNASGPYHATLNSSGTGNSVGDNIDFIPFETDALPVELTTFSASLNGSTVKLFWETETEVNNYGFEIFRSKLNTKDMSWKKIGFIIGNGNSNSPKEYLFLDNKVESGKYFYRLKQIDNDGTFEFSKIIEVDFEIIENFELTQNYPNPFNPTTTIKYSIPKSENVQIKIFDALGSEVKTLLNDYKQPGVYEIEFDGSSDYPSGVYFARLVSGSYRRTIKMTLLK